MSTSPGNRFSRASNAIAELRWRRGMQQRRNAPGATTLDPGPHRAGLPMSELIVIAGLTLAIVWSRGASFINFDRLILLKHFPSAVLVVGLVLSYVGANLQKWSKHDRRPSDLTPARLLWPILLLAAMAIVGSVYAQLTGGVTNTFRNLGAYMLAAYFSARLVTSARDPVRLVTVYFAILAIAGIVTTIVMAAVFVLQGPTAAPFHEMEFLVIPLGVYLATRSDELSLRQLLLVWGFLATAILFRKNTAYLVALGTVAYLWWFHWRVTTHRANAVRRALLFLLGATLVAGLIGTYSYLRGSDRDYIPSGSTEFRLHTYERAWGKFLDSPLWGNGFSDAAVERFDLYDTGIANNVLPTHSDVLDILANGGLVAFLLWAWAHYRLVAATDRFVIGRPKTNSLRRAAPAPDRGPQRHGDAPARASRHVIAMTHTLLCMVLLGVVTYAFNPLLLNPARALLIWSQFGLVAGLACHFSAFGGDAGTRTKRES